jgi:hypothetical protein
MNRIDNEWKRVRIGMAANVNPLMVESMRAMFIAGATAMIKIIGEIKKDEFPEVIRELEREVHSAVEKGKLVASLTANIDALRNLKK